MSRIPIALCGKLPAHLEGLTKMLLPEYDIIHTCSSVHTATTELPALLRNESVTSISHYGTNATSSKPVPGNKLKAIAIGGGFSNSDFEQIKSEVEKVKPGFTLFRADVSRASGMPSTEVLVERVRGALDGARVGEGFENGVHFF